jgi:autotransporter-associated beta strand protein
VGGSANVTFGTVTLGNAANPGNMQTVHLSGGTLTVGSVANSTGNSTFNFNGGTLKAAGASPAFLAADQAYVQAGGAIIDDGGFTNTIAQSLLHDPGLVGTDGGLIKQGNASLVLSGANTYNGGTVVSHGTLICSATGLLGTGNLTVAAGAMCSLQNVGGALADTASVHLSGVLDLTNGVNETVAKLFINGVEMPGGTWNAARAPLHFTGPGNLIVANSGVPFEPPQLTGGQWNTTQFEFQVSGPTGFTYTVQASSNLRDWAEVFSTNPAVMPFFWAESGLTGFPERFYRVSQAP